MAKSTLISTKVALAKHCGMSRQGLDVYLKMPGAPKPRSNGAWDAEEVVAFVNAHPVGKSESDELRAEKLRLEVQRLQVQIGREAGELIPREWSILLFAHLAVSARRIIQDADIPPTIKESMTLQIEELDADAFLAQLAANGGNP